MSTGDDEKTDDDTESFADLIGETKPIARGPARIERTARESRTTRPIKKRVSTADFRWPDPDQPRLAAATGVNDARLFALGRGDPEPEERIDLHGLRLDSGGQRLTDRIASARARGLRCVVVVHGRGQRSGSGEAILRDAVPGWLTKTACAKHLLGFAPAPGRFGGEGATLVLLRRR